ncbi:MAG: hypothetical protein PHH93_11465, partial [Prolixibacteraceae bacterium]|nr:hypothetical protein [Prolixibacteraceae bacterium]
EVSYSLEYGVNTLCIHRDAIRPGQKVLIVDDLLSPSHGGSRWFEPNIAHQANNPHVFIHTRNPAHSRVSCFFK